MAKEMNYFEKNKNVKTEYLCGKVKDNVDVCFVIPAYKRAQYLEKAIDSIIFQNHYGLEYSILVVNDYPEFVEGDLREKYVDYPVVFYRNQTNLGISGNWNRSFELGNSDYIAILHDDDFLLPNYFGVIKKYIKEDKYKEISLFIPQRYILNEEGLLENNSFFHNIFMKLISFRNLYKKECQAIYPKQFFLTMTSLYQAPSCGTIFKKKDFLEYGGFWMDYLYEDFDFATLIDYNKDHSVFMINERVSVSRSNIGGNIEKKSVKISIYESEIYYLSCELKNGNNFCKKYENEIKKFFFESNREDVKQELINSHKMSNYKNNRIKYLWFRLRTRLYYYLKNLDLTEIISNLPNEVNSYE